MEPVVHCPKCEAEVSNPRQPCPRCGHVIDHPQRQRYRKQVVASGVTTLSGYAVGMLGLLLRWEVVGVGGLILGFVGGVWFMVSLYLWLRTGV